MAIEKFIYYYNIKTSFPEKTMGSNILLSLADDYDDMKIIILLMDGVFSISYFDLLLKV